MESFTHDELVARDNANLDGTWLRDESLEDADNLPAPEVIARDRRGPDRRTRRVRGRGCRARQLFCRLLIFWLFATLPNVASSTTIKLHDLRHFYASGLIAAGCDVVTVQRSLGHSKATTTLNTDAHLWPTAEDRTRKAAESIMPVSLGEPAGRLAENEVSTGE